MKTVSNLGITITKFAAGIKSRMAIREMST
jgi:hypothetical protein